MPIGYIFWTIMLIWIIFGLSANWPSAPAAPRAYWPLGGSLLLFVLLFLLGWKAFGFILQG